MRTTIRLASVYLDLLVVLTLLELLWPIVGSFFPPTFPAWLFRIVVCVLLVFAIRRFVGSVGDWLMAPISERARVSAPRPPRTLWINIVVGVLFFLDATKNFVRWTLLDRPMPVMGVIPEGFAQIARDVVTGAAYLAVAILLFRLKRAARWLAGGVLGFSFLSVLVSWERFPEAIERSVVARRESRACRCGMAR